MPLPDTMFGQQRRLMEQRRVPINQAAWRAQLQSAGAQRAPLQTMQERYYPTNHPFPPPTVTPLLQRNSSGYYAGQPGAPGQPFSGVDVMRALQNVGDVTRRVGATAREFGIGAGVPPATGPAVTAFGLGGALPTAPAQPFFRRPKWWPR